MTSAKLEDAFLALTQTPSVPAGTSEGVIMTSTAIIRPVAGRGLSPALHYTLRTALLTAKNFGFVIFSLAMPVILYVVFSRMYGTVTDDSGVNWSAMIMVSMAAYGSLGAAMSGGAQLPSRGRHLGARRPGDCGGARRLLRDDSLNWPSGQVGLLDLGLRESRRDAFVVSDHDGGGWLETFSIPDPSIAPKGCSVTQLQLPLLDGEARTDMIARLEELADRGLPGWRDRLEFRRDSVARGRSGAVDYPGTSWRDRPAIDRGAAVYLVGDQVAASESAARHLPRSLPLAGEQG